MLYFLDSAKLPLIKSALARYPLDCKPDYPCARYMRQYVSFGASLI